MPLPEQIVFFSAGAFFLVGLLCGGWKYHHIHQSADHKASAPEYVNIAHRAALMYAFACLLLQQVVVQSRLSDAIELACVVVLVTYFAIAQLGYIIHGFLQDTDNQLARPHRMGKTQIPALAMRIFMVSLFWGEVLAFALLFGGAVHAIGWS